MLVPDHVRPVLRVPLTPLIDVVFILLLFFMLSSSFVRQQQIEFRAAAAPGDAANEDVRRLLLHVSGRVDIDAEIVAIDSARFADRLDAWRQHPRKVIVAAMHDVPVQALVRLLDRLQAAQVGGVDLAPSVQP